MYTRVRVCVYVCVCTGSVSVFVRAASMGVASHQGVVKQEVFVDWLDLQWGVLCAE